jgi:hypothetical protein
MMGYLRALLHLVLAREWLRIDESHHERIDQADHNTAESPTLHVTNNPLDT